MYIIIVNTKEDWGYYTVINNDQGYPIDFPDYYSAEQYYINTSFANHFSVRYVNMED